MENVLHQTVTAVIHISKCHVILVRRRLKSQLIVTGVVGWCGINGFVHVVADYLMHVEKLIRKNCLDKQAEVGRQVWGGLTLTRQWCKIQACRQLTGEGQTLS